MKNRPLLITITGTESTGKSTLAEALAAHYKTTFVPDVSRVYLEQLNRAYTEQDVLAIARQIIIQEDKSLAECKHLLFSDNDLINIKIWLHYYQWQIPNWLTEAITKRKSDLYLVCNIDLPWVADAQRKNEDDRQELLNQFTSELAKNNCNFKMIQGKINQRTQHAIAQLNNFLDSSILQ